MRASSFATAALATTFSLAFASRYSPVDFTQNVCSGSQYGSLLCLSSYDPAAALCTSSLTAVTATATVTTTSTAVETETTSYDVTSQVTVSSITVLSYTTTITTGPLSTITTISTHTDSFSTNTTTYVSASSTSAAARRRRQASSSCDATDGYAALQTLSTDALSTACSCIGDYPTTTETTTATDVVTSTTTEVDGPASTTTMQWLERITFTSTLIIPAPTSTIVTSTSVTSTLTVTLPAPTYTHVFGPKDGCADLAAGPAQILNYNVTDVSEATQQCKDACSQISVCDFVFVQYMLPHYGTDEPYYECWFNPHHYETSDLNCTANSNVYGTANGFNALGRGT